MSHVSVLYTGHGKRSPGDTKLQFNSINWTDDIEKKRNFLGEKWSNSTKKKDARGAIDVLSHQAWSIYEV